MDVTPKAFRDVQFREARKGYHPEDVDEFLEQAATGVEALLERVRQADQRTQRAESAAAEAGGTDETLRRTLVLAQRTADMAVQESREQAARIVSSAEAQAQTLVTEAEERARRLHGEALADVHAELAKLEAIRSQAQHEVDLLVRWADEQRAHLRSTLSDAMSMLDRAEVGAPPPPSTPIDVPFARRTSSALPPPEPVPVPAAPLTGGTAADAAQLPVEPVAPRHEAFTARADAAAPPQAESYEPGPSTASVPAASVPPASANGDADPDATTALRPEGERAPVLDPDEEAMDSFFDDDGEFADDRRFGGRLRRRR